jgi:hypothetical protein
VAERSNGLGVTGEEELAASRRGGWWIRSGRRAGLSILPGPATLRGSCWVGPFA